MLDTSHVPHITIVQRFVRAKNLDKVFTSVSKVVEKEQPTQLDLTATDCYYSPYKQLGVVGISVQPTLELTAFQEKIIAAVDPFAIDHGTGAAFVPRQDGGSIDKQSIDYVKAFVGEYSGNNFNPHVTVGLGGNPLQKSWQINHSLHFDLGRILSAFTSWAIWEPLRKSYEHRTEKGIETMPMNYK